MFGGVLGGFLSVWFFLVRGEGEVEERVAWGTMGLLGGAWAMMFGVFMSLVKKGYKKTFFSTQTGKAQVIQRFMKGEGDAMKSSIMKRNKKMWRAIRDAVKEWVLLNYWMWEADRPEWFTESWIAKVPPDMIPSEAKQAVKDIRANARRRSSLGALVVVKEEDTRAVQPIS